MSVIKAVILAAGAGTRMKSEKPKVIHKIMMQTSDFIGTQGQVFVLFGDTPLITGASLSKLREYHDMNNHGVTVLSTVVDNSNGYGRIIRSDEGDFLKSVEHKDATKTERKVKEINSGMYIYNASALKDSLDKLTNDNSQGEYYLPDTLESIMNDGLKVEAMKIFDYEEILGVNSKVQLFEATSIIRHRINYAWMEAGVTMIDANQVYIGKDVELSKEVTIMPGTIIEGKTSIGWGTTIGPNTKIIDSHIGEFTKIDQSTVLNSKIGNHTTIGPFAYIRPNSDIGNHIKVGDFVEIKNATIKDHTKISHLTYIGDADVGEYVNFGCGTVVVNYDGKSKHRSVIGDHAFIGCNTNLISPVIVESNAYTAAGSTITKTVPKDALAIARARQENKLEWVKKRQ